MGRKIFLLVVLLVSCAIAWYAGFLLVAGSAESSRGAQLFGFLLLLIAASLVYTCTRFNKLARAFFLPVFLPVLSWLLAFVAIPQIGFDLWLHGLPVVSALVLVFWLLASVSRRKL